MGQFWEVPKIIPESFLGQAWQKQRGFRKKKAALNFQQTQVMLDLSQDIPQPFVDLQTYGDPISRSRHSGITDPIFPSPIGGQLTIYLDLLIVEN
ncbi:hypothetical protein [Geopsychrobacter electrodiphilus]|uniref:hypothetical protein n=1 Tax=Geopsychrobacter electrodiphilus TaxID=225196 RepID=UPI00036FBD93|nr:hypothetical protein [Geopsychrobacter electrodiphilus]